MQRSHYDYVRNLRTTTHAAYASQAMAASRKCAPVIMTRPMIADTDSEKPASFALPSTSSVNRVENTAIGARQHEPCADGEQQAEWQSQADDLQQLHHIVTAGGQVHQHADHQHGDERVGVGERLNERGHDGGDLHIGKHEHDHDQVGVERDGAEEAFRHVA